MLLGDGALKMTGLELSTGSHLGLGAVVFVFNDGELSQIAQAQQIPYNPENMYGALKPLKISALAEATDCKFFALENNQAVEQVIASALQAAADGHMVVVDVHIDYSKRTRFTQGVVKSTLKRFAPRDKLRAISRALVRKVTG